MLVGGSIDGDFEDTAEVYADFDGMAGFQARFYVWNKWKKNERCRLRTDEGVIQIS